MARGRIASHRDGARRHAPSRRRYACRAEMKRASRRALNASARNSRGRCIAAIEKYSRSRLVACRRHRLARRKEIAPILALIIMAWQASAERARRPAVIGGAPVVCRMHRSGNNETAAKPGSVVLCRKCIFRQCAPPQPIAYSHVEIAPCLNDRKILMKRLFFLA